jgi:hypothetical protein
MIAYPGSNVLRLSGASSINLETGQLEYLGAETVLTFRVQTTQYVDVPWASWPVTMHYIPDSQGDFLGVLNVPVTADEDVAYRVLAEAQAGMNQVGLWDMPLTVLTRQE